MRIAVAGGSGWVGALVVEAVRAGGDTPVVLTRSTGVDLTTGAGLDAALAGVSAVIDVTNKVTTRRAAATQFFESATTALLAAGRRGGVEHHVALSIVGSDRVDFGYYLGKRRQEQLVLAGDAPASVLRATQFHEFAAQLVQRAGAVTVVPRMLSQPVAAGDVALALVQLARQAPVGLAPELAGPERLQVTDMVRRLVRARGLHRLLVPLRLPGQVGRDMAGGALLPSSDGPRGRQTFQEWLDEDTAGRATAARPAR